MVVERGAGGARVNGVGRDRVAGDNALVVGAENDSNAAAAGGAVSGSGNLVWHDQGPGAEIAGLLVAEPEPTGAIGEVGGDRSKP